MQGLFFFVGLDQDFFEIQSLNVNIRLYLYLHEFVGELCIHTKHDSNIIYCYSTVLY
jgi:hypothetical protein